MNNCGRITVLVDNMARGHGLWAEHGLALGVEFNGRRILFDTGQSTEVLAHNMQILDWDVRHTDCVVLSHGHYDHTGGLPVVARKRDESLPIYAHPRVFEAKYVCRNDGEECRDAGVPWIKEELVAYGADFRLSRKPVELTDNIILTGEIPPGADFETPGDVFWLKREGELVRDLLLDDQAMALQTPRGVVVVLGCSHAGVVSTLKYVARLTGRDNIYAVIGGMHLGDAGETRIQLTIQAFLDFDVQKVVPLHCTGFTAMAEMQRRLGERFILGATGLTLEL